MHGLKCFVLADQQYAQAISGDRPNDSRCLAQEISDNMIRELSDAAAELPLNDKDELSVDWLNGRPHAGCQPGTESSHYRVKLLEQTHQEFLKRWLSQPVLAQRPLWKGSE